MPVNDDGHPVMTSYVCWVTAPHHNDDTCISGENFS